MGIWNTGLFSNDTTLDIRDTYIRLLKQQLSNDEACKITINEYQELMGTDEEPLFWYALAESQWDAGRLIPEIKEYALTFIQQKGGISLWEENSKEYKKWEVVLRKLKEKLDSPMPSERKYSKPIEFKHNPWNLGDVYAYQFHTDLAEEKGFYGKYILMQKIGDVVYYEDTIFTAIQVFDKIYDFMPGFEDLEELKDVRILPLIYPPKNISDCVPPLEWYLKATMLYEKKNHYPKKYLSFVGNKKIAENEYAGNDLSDMYWSQSDMDEWLIDYHLSWQGIEY